MTSNWYRYLQLNWRKFKRSIECVIFGLFDTVVLLHRNPHPNEAVVAIVHVELLGDYVLWWPYGRALVQYLRDQGKCVVLVLNEIVLPLATQHFPDCTVIGINRVCFVRDLPTRAALLWQLRQIGTSVTYHSVCPRGAMIIQDTAVKALGAPAWGFDATFADRPWFDRLISRRLYTYLLPPLVDVHQSQRHHAFIRAVGIPDTNLEARRDFAEGIEPPTQTPYFVIAPGASRTERRWPVNHFIAVAQRVLARHPDWRCVVVGTQGERALGEVMARTLGNGVDNLAGTTELLDLVRWIAHAQLVVGNDSAACHIAAACGVASIAVVGGGHPGQFFPYDPSEARVRRLPVTVSEPMDCFGCDWICRYRIGKNQPFPCIAAIPIERVWGKVEPLLLSDSL